MSKALYNTLTWLIYVGMYLFKIGGLRVAWSAFHLFFCRWKQTLWLDLQLKFNKPWSISTNNSNYIVFFLRGFCFSTKRNILGHVGTFQSVFSFSSPPKKQRVRFVSLRCGVNRLGGTWSRRCSRPRCHRPGWSRRPGSRTFRLDDLRDDKQQPTTTKTKGAATKNNKKNKKQEQ